MNKYCNIKNNIVVAVEPEYVDIFPDIHITERFFKEFIDNCIIVDESVIVIPGMIYEDGVFKEAPIIEMPALPESPEEIETRPSEIDMLGQEVVSLKIANMQKDSTINMLVQELVNIKLQLLQGLGGK